MIDMFFNFPLGIVPVLFIAVCLFVFTLPYAKLRRAGLYGLLVFAVFLALGEYVDRHSAGDNQSARGLLLIYTMGLAFLSGIFAFLLGLLHGSYLEKKPAQNSTLYLAGMVSLSILIILPFIAEVNMWRDSAAKNAVHKELFRQQGGTTKK
jgi:uncharacterized membrane protein